MAALIDDAADGHLAVWTPPRDRAARIPALMRRYAGQPMVLADVSLLLPAEHLGHGRILSTDEREFGACRWKRHRPFDDRLV